MGTNTVQKPSSAKSYKIRGMLVGIDLVNHTIMIRTSEHDEGKVRRLTMTPNSEILAGRERKTLADAMLGDWVHAHFVNEGDHAVLKSLHLPRGLGSSRVKEHSPEALP